MAGVAELGFSPANNRHLVSPPPYYASVQHNLDCTNLATRANITPGRLAVYKKKQEPTFRERYPEGRHKLLALSEGGPKVLHHNSSNKNLISSVDLVDSETAEHVTNRANSHKPKQPRGPVVTLDQNLSHQRPTCQIQGSNRPPRMGVKGKMTATPGGAQQSKSPPFRPAPIYASEQSLPDKLSQALKGLGHSLRPHSGGNSARNSATVAADDVVYYPSSTGGSSGGSSLGQKPKPPPFSSTPNGPHGLAVQCSSRNFSQSSETLNELFPPENPSGGCFSQSPPPIPPKASSINYH